MARPNLQKQRRVLQKRAQIAAHKDAIEKLKLKIATAKAELLVARKSA